MAGIAGYGGTVKIIETGGILADILGVKNWSFTDTADIEDSTQMSSSATGWKNHTLTLRGGVGTIEGFIDDSEAGFEGAPPLISSGSAVDFELAYDGTHYWAGTGTITSVKASVAVDGIITFTMEVQLDGELTYPTSP